MKADAEFVDDLRIKAMKADISCCRDYADQKWIRNDRYHHAIKNWNWDLILTLFILAEIWALIYLGAKWAVG